MPRSLATIIATADELARRFESHEPSLDALRDATALRNVARAAEQRAMAESALAQR